MDALLIIALGLGGSIGLLACWIDTLITRPLPVVVIDASDFEI